MRTGVRGVGQRAPLLAGREEVENTRTKLQARLAAGLLLGLVVALLLPAAAANAAAYRFWGYYQLNGTTWQFATKGPAETNPADGSVEGWRFALSGENDARMPRATPMFDDICGDTEASTGEKRVAVVIDYGRAADNADNAEPPAAVGRCAVVATAATGLEVLSEVADVRTDKSLICGVDDFPATGCGDEVQTVPAEAQAADTPVTLELPTAEKADDSATADDSDDDSDTGTYVGIGIAVLVAAAVALVALRRRRTT